MLSIIIPAHNEESCIEETITRIVKKLDEAGLEYEIVAVNDNSTDKTEAKLKKISELSKNIKYANNTYQNGFGFAVRKGLELYRGDAVALVMGDGSDLPEDIVKYYKELEKGYDCVFGSRFIKGSNVQNYPFHKLILNRMANYCIKLLFRTKHNDITNAFKCYRREVIDGIKPILSNHFNLTVELPLKAIVRGYNYTKVPISWSGRTKGVSKLKIKEMGSRYLFIVLYVLLEKFFAKGDYKRMK
jgi:dolichol-phosphate mannosyltransferase|tara:strand:+ start:2312 stop:3043 length:732 start_codon:yes stop_codon:yes gene_type:complete